MKTSQSQRGRNRSSIRPTSSRIMEPLRIIFSASSRIRRRIAAGVTPCSRARSSRKMTNSASELGIGLSASSPVGCWIRTRDRGGRSSAAHWLQKLGRSASLMAGTPIMGWISAPHRGHGPKLRCVVIRDDPLPFPNSRSRDRVRLSQPRRPRASS